MDMKAWMFAGGGLMASMVVTTMLISGDVSRMKEEQQAKHRAECEMRIMDQQRSAASQQQGLTSGAYGNDSSMLSSQPAAVEGCEGVEVPASSSAAPTGSAPQSDPYAASAQPDPYATNASTDPSASSPQGQQGQQGDPYAAGTQPDAYAAGSQGDSAAGYPDYSEAGSAIP